jgi:hypothetical protein
MHKGQGHTVFRNEKINWRRYRIMEQLFGDIAMCFARGRKMLVTDVRTGGRNHGR